MTTMKKGWTDVVGTLITAAMLAYLVLWWAFMFRNPKANIMSFFRDFTSIVKMEKMEGYQL